MYGLCLVLGVTNAIQEQGSLCASIRDKTAFVGAGTWPNLSATAEAEYVSCLVRRAVSLLHQRAALVRVVADPPEVGSFELLH
jgi:hypothetical protein